MNVMLLPQKRIPLNSWNKKNFKSNSNKIKTNMTGTNNNENNNNLNLPIEFLLCLRKFAFFLVILLDSLSGWFWSLEDIESFYRIWSEHKYNKTHLFSRKLTTFTLITNTDNLPATVAFRFLFFTGLAPSSASDFPLSTKSSLSFFS